MRDKVTIMDKQFRLHSSGLWVAEDGEVMWTTTYKTGHQRTHRTYGYKRKRDGYMTVKYQGKRYYVHRLVAECYISNPENKPEVDHINTNRSDNRVENLRWSTRPENQNNPLTLQKKKGENHPLYGKHHSEESRKKMSDAMKGKPKKRPVVGTNMETGFTVEFETITDAHITLNINISNISSCLKGRLKSAGGYVWQYA